MTLRQALKTGRVKRVPVIAGVDRDENLVGFPVTVADYTALVQAQYGSIAAQVLALYPVSRFNSPFVAWRMVAADSNTVCSALRTAQKLSRWMPVFAYEIDYGDPAAPSRIALRGESSSAIFRASAWLRKGRCPTTLIAALRSVRVAGEPSVAMRVMRSVNATTPAATLCRSAAHASSFVASAPASTSASRPASDIASWMPVFIPWPPAGLCTWAASPQSRTRPLRGLSATLWCTRNRETHTLSRMCACVASGPRASSSAWT